MTTKPEYDFTKLPKWAQKYIEDIERERDVAVRALNEFQDADTPSPYWVDEYVCTGEQQGPSNKRRYIQGHRMTVQVGKGEIDFFLREPNVLEISAGSDTIRFSPYSSNCIRIEEPKR
jgi:hypothetical protein